jgi:hypothetical protein
MAVKRPDPIKTPLGNFWLYDTEKKELVALHLEENYVKSVKPWILGKGYSDEADWGIRLGLQYKEPKITSGQRLDYEGGLIELMHTRYSSPSSDSDLSLKDIRVNDLVSVAFPENPSFEEDGKPLIILCQTTTPIGRNALRAIYVRQPHILLSKYQLDNLKAMGLE